MAFAQFAPGTFDQQMPHGLRRGGEEMAAARILAVRTINEPEPGLVNKSSRLKCVPLGLLGHLGGGEFPELFVHQRQEFLRSFGIALLDGIQQSGHVAHSSFVTAGGKNFKPLIFAHLR